MRPYLRNCAVSSATTTRQQIVKRLAAIDRTADCDVLVAEDDEGRVVAWLQVAIADRLCEEPCAEITGLVVGEPARGGGIGQRLIDAAAQWVRARGVQRMRVRSRQERERAHRFDERAAFGRIKNQVVFAKSLT